MSNHYLDIDGVISFKEFVMSMRKGSLNDQIVDLAENEFPTLAQMGSLIIGDWLIKAHNTVNYYNLQSNGLNF